MGDSAFLIQSKVSSSGSLLFVSLSSYVFTPTAVHGFISVRLLGPTAEAVWLPGVETFTLHSRALLMPEKSTVHSVSSSSRDGASGVSLLEKFPFLFVFVCFVIF